MRSVSIPGRDRDRDKDETSYPGPKLLHGRMYLVPPGGFLGGYDDKTLNAFVAMAKKHDIKLILCEPNYGGGMFTKPLISAVQQYAYDCGVENADWSTVAKEERIFNILEPVMNQHRLIVCPAVIEQNFESTKHIDGERGPLYCLFYQITRMVRAKGALAQDDRLGALAGAVAYFVEHMASDTHPYRCGRTLECPRRGPQTGARKESSPSSPRAGLDDRNRPLCARGHRRDFDY